MKLRAVVKAVKVDFWITDGLMEELDCESINYYLLTLNSGLPGETIYNARTIFHHIMRPKHIS